VIRIPGYLDIRVMHVGKQLLVDLEFLQLSVGTPESAVGIPPMLSTGSWFSCVGSLFHEFTIADFPLPKVCLPGFHVFGAVDLP
jgi:hypothetical protein